MFIFRSHFGPELLIVVLTMSEEDNRERISRRHGGNEEVVRSLMGIGKKLYDPVAEDEEGVVSIEIGKAATKEENVNMILDTCHAYYCQQGADRAPLKIQDGHYRIELQTNLRKDFQVREKAPTRH